MEANLLIACDPVTSWYTFTYSLSWSNNCEVADVLSDIPFVSVGVLVFGVSVLFLVVRRVSLSTVWLFSSALLAFVAAVMDLGKILADEVTESTTFAASEPVIRAREILFALSIGFRFLFYWSYVAEPPRKDLSAVSIRKIRNINFLTFECSREPHSGSWMRWGLPGKLLGVGLLAAIMVITALQITWRVVPRFHQYGSVYATDAALELLVSFLLLLKLLLNTVTGNSPNGMLVHTFRECLAPISGLLFNIAIGVGGLLSFAFTESTVGRLLQSFEVYVIVVFVVVIAFLKHCDILLARTLPQGKKRRDVVFTLPEPVRGSTFRITPPCVETPRMSMIFGAATQNMESSREVLRRSARRSLNHVSSWVSSRVSRNRSRCGDEEVKLWNAENVKVDPPYTGSANTELRASIVSSTQESKGWGELVREAPTNHMSIISALDAQSAIARSMQGSIHSGRILHSSGADVSQRTILPQVQTGSVPVSSVPPSVSSRTKHAGSMVTPSQDSPVYGLGGIQSLASASGSRMSLDELLRQQSQLDQSIEALKLFSTRTSTDSNSVRSPKSVELTRSSSTGQRTVSSDVSLSNFPVPPWLTTPSPSLPSSPGLSTIKRIRGDRRVRLAAARTTPIQDTHTSFPPKTSAPLVDIPSSPQFNSIPHTPLEEENESLSAEAGKSSHLDCGGTRYNVTSFIGGRLFAGSSDSTSNVFKGLATPSEPRQGSQEKPWSRESQSSVETIHTGSGIKKVPPRMPPVPGRREGLSAPPAVAKLSPLAHSSILPPGDVVDDTMKYRTNDQTTRSPKITLSPPAPVMDRAEKGMSIPPTSAQLVQEPSLPLTVSAEGVDGIQRMFVRPRPPPLTIKSYAEQHPGKPWVQVLADD